MWGRIVERLFGPRPTPLRKAQVEAAKIRSRGGHCYVESIIEGGHETLTVVTLDPAELEAADHRSKSDAAARLRRLHGGWD